MATTYNGVDDLTVAYILATQGYFEDLKQVAAQLAGVLVLTAAGSKSGSPDHPLLSSAEQLYQNAADGLRCVRVTARARLHHARLQTALEKLGVSLALAKGALAKESRDPLIPLESAYADLRSAARSLPGFEMISFDNCCCHAQ